MQRGLAVLSLDISTRTGYAFGRRWDKPPVMRSGTWILPKIIRGDLGRTLSAFQERLALALDEWDPELVVFEAPFVLPGRTSQATARALMSLPGICELVCHDYAVRCREVSNWDHRRFALGFTSCLHEPDVKAVYKVDRERGRDMGRERMKHRVIEWARGQGLSPSDDDAADAAMLHHYACAVVVADLRAA